MKPTKSIDTIQTMTFFLLAIHAIWEDLPSVAYLSGIPRLDMGVLTWFHQVFHLEHLIYAPEGLLFLKGATIVTCLAAGMRLFSRGMVPLATVFALLHGGILREYSHFFHTMVIPLQFAMILSFRSILVVRNDGNDSGWKSLFYVWFAVSYLLAGLSKIANGGWTWWEGGNLRAIVVQNSVNRMEFDWGIADVLFQLDPLYYSLLGLMTLVIEISYPLVLFSRLAKFGFPLMAIAMHLGILATQGILFLDLIAFNGLFFWLWRREPRTVRVGIGPSLAAIGLVCIWILRIEFYPFTSWQMYSGQFNRTQVPYWEMTLVDSGGDERPFSPDEFIPALKDCRYRDYFFAGPRETGKLLQSVVTAASAHGVTVEEVRIKQYLYDISSSDSRKKVLQWQTRAYGSPQLEQGLPAE